MRFGSSHPTAQKKVGWKMFEIWNFAMIVRTFPPLNFSDAFIPIKNVSRVRQLSSNPTKGVNVLAVGCNLLHQKTTITVVYSSPKGEARWGTARRENLDFGATDCTLQSIPPLRGCGFADGQHNLLQIRIFLPKGGG